MYQQKYFDYKMVSKIIVKICDSSDSSDSNTEDEYRSEYIIKAI